VDQRLETPTTTPDHDEFVSLAKLYSLKHPEMHKGTSSCGGYGSSKFEDGITNGIDWYVVTGGMQDFNYLYSNCMEITLELSCVKKPKKERLQEEWDMNRESLLSFLERARGAVKGIVTDSNGNVVDGAVIRVSDRNKDVTTTSTGEFWRILVPGTYMIKAMKDDMESEEVEVVVNDNDVEGPRVDLQLTRTLSTTTTTTTTTEKPNQDKLVWRDPFGLVCFQVSWVGLSGCDDEDDQ